MKLGKLKFIVLCRVGDFIFIFGHVSQLEQAMYKIVAKEND